MLILQRNSFCYYVTKTLYLSICKRFPIKLFSFFISKSKLYTYTIILWFWLLTIFYIIYDSLFDIRYSFILIFDIDIFILLIREHYHSIMQWLFLVRITLTIAAFQRCFPWVHIIPIIHHFVHTTPPFYNF